MFLKSIALHNFRNYSKTSFTFHDVTTIIVGKNGAGKSNLIEAIFLLASGKSFHADKERQLIAFGKDFARISGKIGGEEDGTLEAVFAESGTQFLKKKYLVNGVARRRSDFAGHLTAVLFTPQDLDLVAGQPGNRRRFLDEVLEQVDGDYRIALTTYTKALRQRNALLEQVQETGVRNDRLFAYWDDLLIKHASTITYKREEFIEAINVRTKDFFPCLLSYDKSLMSKERLLQYRDAEVGAGVTLVGPHRDDVIIQTYHQKSKELIDVRYFSSRGQQRLVTLELKLAQIAYLQEKTKKNPLLLLDDIFSELDEANIEKVLTLMNHHQVIITTTHKEFVTTIGLKDISMIELDGR